MKDRMHTLKAEIKDIESVIDTLSGHMLEHATEELKNLRFEMDMLKRKMRQWDGVEASMHEAKGH
jgi:hypothetical protein